MSDDITDRMRARRVPRWVHSTGTTPRFKGTMPDRDCHNAADEIERLRAALQQADLIMGHDDDATEWRERWAGLWAAVAKNATTAALDCRTCTRYNVGECLSVWKCVDGSRYQQNRLVQLWAGEL